MQARATGLVSPRTPSDGGPLRRGPDGCGVSRDAAIGALLVATVTPVAIEVALAVQHEIHARLEDPDAIRAILGARAESEDLMGRAPPFVPVLSASQATATRA